MKYISTRGDAPTLGFSDAVLTGLARDGGLYVPEIWPKLDHKALRDLRGKSYGDVAKTVLQPFLGDEISSAEFSDMVDEFGECFTQQNPQVQKKKQQCPKATCNHHWCSNFPVTSTSTTAQLCEKLRSQRVFSAGFLASCGFPFMANLLGCWLVVAA